MKRPGVMLDLVFSGRRSEQKRKLLAGLSPEAKEVAACQSYSRSA
jgi:hypothetical protein